MTSWFNSLHSHLQQEPIYDWIVASLLLFILGSWLVWVATLWQKHHAEGRSSRWTRLPEVRIILWIAQFAYGFGIPYAVLLLGIASPRLLGLTETDWVSSLGSGGGLAGVALAILIVGWWGYRRDVPPPADLSPWPLALLNVAALQAHWAFYRTGATLWMQDGYNSVWAGLALVALEAALVPATWQALASPNQAEKILRPAAFAFCSAVLFYYTHNLWLCWVFHCVGEMALTRWIPTFAGFERQRHAP